MLLVLGLQHAAAMAQDATPEVVLGWAGREWAEAQSPISCRGLTLRYTVRMFAQHTEAEFQELTQLIGDKPEHPRRAEWEESARRRSKGPDVAHYQVWFSDPGHIRVNRDLDGVEGFLDQTISPDLMWTLTPVQLTLVDPAQARPDRDVRGNLLSWERDIGYFRFAGAHLGRTSGMQPVNVRSAGNTWLIVARTQSDIEYTFEARWDASLARAFINRGTQTRNAPTPSAAGSSFVVSDWKDHGTLGWFAERIDELFPDGRPRNTLQLDQVEACDPATLSERSAEPSLIGTDPVRGPYSFKAVYDLRPARNVRLERQPSGFVEVPLPAAPGGARARWLNLVGWGALVCIIVALVVLRMKRSGAA